MSSTYYQPGGYQPPVPLTPLGFTDIFAASLTIMGRALPTFLILGAIPGLLGFAIVVVVLVAAASVWLPFFQYAFAHGEMPDTASLSGGILVFFAVLFLGLILHQSVILICNTLSARTALAVNRGEPLNSQFLVGHAIHLIVPALVLTVIYGGIMTVAFVLLSLLSAVLAELDAMGLIIPTLLGLVIGAAVVGIRLALTSQVLGIEQIGPIQALQNSWVLTGGSALRVFGYAVGIQVVIGIITQVVTAVPSSLLTPDLNAAMLPHDPLHYFAEFFPLLLASSAISFLVSAATLPFLSIFFSVLYLDLRRRREALAGQPVFV